MSLLSGPGGIWPVVSGLRGSPRVAAVAFLGEAAPYLLPQFGAGDVIVCDASDQTVKNGLTSVKGLTELMHRGVTILSHSNLHAKVVAVGKTVVVGSMNASQSSASLSEAALLSTSPDIVRASRALVRHLASEAVTVDETFLRRLRKLPVRRSGGGNSSKRGTAPVVRVLRYKKEEPPRYVAQAVDARNRSERMRGGFDLHASWGEPDEGRDRVRCPGDLVVWIKPSDGDDPQIEISRIVDCEFVGRRWVYYEVVPTKLKKARLSELKRLVASRGFRGDLAALGEGTQTIRLEGLEEDLRKVFGSTFPPTA